MDVRLYAEFDLLHIGVIHRAGGEADRPAVGQFGRKGQSGTASRAVAHDGDQRAFAHVAHESVGGAVARVFCQRMPFEGSRYSASGVEKSLCPLPVLWAM